MKHITVLILLLFAGFSCTESGSDDQVLNGVCGVKSVPGCILTLIEAFEQQPDAAYVLSIVSKGERVYWFRENNNMADDSEPVYNEQCEQVCDMDCECAGPFTNCPVAPISDWEVIWQK